MGAGYGIETLPAFSQFPLALPNWHLSGSADFSSRDPPTLALPFGDVGTIANVLLVGFRSLLLTVMGLRKCAFLLPSSPGTTFLWGPQVPSS